jgi:Fe-S cluster assembly ATPase SufC
MPIFAVRMKGLLTKSQRERLAAAGIRLAAQEPSMEIEGIKTGPPIYTLHIESSSPEEALRTVREVMEPDTTTFSNWESGPA